MITVICKAHKIKWLNNSIDNFNRQDYKYKELLLILNHELKDINITVPSNCFIIRSDDSQLGKLSNLGLNWMRENNRNIYAIMDSDDWYGESYLSESIKDLGDNDIIGKTDYHFKYMNEIYRANGSVRDNNCCILNPTCLGKITNVNYSEIAILEDIDFVFKHREHGYKVGYNNSDYRNWVYNVQDNSMQNRHGWMFLHSLTAYNTISKNQNFKIFCGDKLFWKYGDEILFQQEAKGRG